MHSVPGKTELLSITGMYWGPLVILPLTRNSSSLKNSLKIYHTYFHLTLLITLSLAEKAHLFESLDTVYYFTG